MINDIPNFDQFIQLIIDDYKYETKPDPHLESFWQKCDMCKIHYDVIGKVETSKEDISYINFKVGAGQKTR